MSVEHEDELQRGACEWKENKSKGVIMCLVKSKLPSTSEQQNKSHFHRVLRLVVDLLRTLSDMDLCM